MNFKPHLAWEIYINMETSNESLSLLNLIANDCYKMGQFYYSVKAFDVLDTDYKNYAIIYSCESSVLGHTEYAWVLTRDPVEFFMIEDDIIEAAKEAYKKLSSDYDADFTKSTQGDTCDYE